MPTPIPTTSGASRRRARPGRPGARLRAALIAGLLLAPGIAAAVDQSLENLTGELVELRGEVQELNAELEQARQDHRNRMQSLERQRGELEAQARREELRVAKLEKDVAKMREQSAAAGAEAERIEPAVLQALAGARAWVETALPFKRAERLAELEDLERKIRTGAVSPHNGVKRLWAFYEDELRLTGENGIYRQPVELEGEEVLADVARLGMVMLFFETSEERYGAALRTDGEWRFQLYQEREPAAQVADLFDNLRKQVRTGYFDLPNALADPEYGP